MRAYHLILVATLAFSLSGCGGTTPAEGDANATTSTEDVASEIESGIEASGMSAEEYNSQ